MTAVLCCLHPSIFLTDGLHMQGRPQGLWARCAHAAGACPALVPVRQPGLCVPQSLLPLLPTLCSLPGCTREAWEELCNSRAWRARDLGTLRLRPARHSCTKAGQSFLLHRCFKHLLCLKHLLVLFIQGWCGPTTSRWLFPEEQCFPKDGSLSR